MDPAALREQITAASRAGVVGCSVTRAEGDESPPIVLCARHKALAIHAELDVLAVHEEVALAQLEASRDVAAAAGRPNEEITPLFEARVAEVRSEAAAKRVALQSEAVAVDAALECALAAVAALTEVWHYSWVDKSPPTPTPPTHPSTHFPLASSPGRCVSRR